MTVMSFSMSMKIPNALTFVITKITNIHFVRNIVRIPYDVISFTVQIKLKKVQQCCLYIDPSLASVPVREARLIVPQKCGTFMFVPHVPQMWYKCGTQMRPHTFFRSQSSILGSQSSLYPKSGVLLSLYPFQSFHPLQNMYKRHASYTTAAAAWNLSCVG